jgi:hypothetical protein
MAHTEEEHETLRRRHDSLVKATLKQTEELSSLRGKLEVLEFDNTRLSSMLEAANMSVQTLGDEFNKGNQAANREVERLRELCKQHNIDPAG